MEIQIVFIELHLVWLMAWNMEHQVKKELTSNDIVA